MVWTFAQAIQEQAERFGAYAGIAAFFGLALLAILYFAQARELKRLRDWAGRAPERARELEERVMGQAATRTAPAEAPPPAASSPPVADVAGAAASGATAAAGTGADAAPAVLGASSTAGPNGAPPAEVSAADEEKPAEIAASTGLNGSGDNAAVGARPAQDGDGSLPSEGDRIPPDAGSATPALEPPGDPGAAPAEPPTVVAASTAGGEDGPAESPGPREDSIGEAAIPAAARATGPAASPRPATAAALRVSRPSATSPRPSSTPPRRPAPPPRPLLSDPPRRRRGAGFMAMVGIIALLVLGGAALAISSLGGDEEAAPEPNRADVTDPGTSTPEPEATPDVTASRADTSVVVLNGTAITGLAAEVSQQLSQSGYPEGQTANYTGAQREESVVLYREGFADQARDVGELLEVSRVESMQGEAQAEQLEGAEVVVIAGHDQAP